MSVHDLLIKRKNNKDIRKLEKISIGYDAKLQKYILKKDSTCTFTKLMVEYGRAVYEKEN